jgi:prepilin-type N-terminal cleavage/methylation domain-containing protein
MKKKGFTLIELLVVISIISMLTSVILSSLNDARKKARDSAKISYLLQVQKALAMYYSDYGGYPTATQTGGSGPHIFSSEILKYIPTVNSGIYYRGLDSNNVYVAAASSIRASSYFLATKLENRSNPVSVLDSDRTTNINSSFPALTVYGKSDDCVTNQDNSSQPELCYDIAP